MNKYGPKAKQTVEKTMHEYAQGTLHSGKYQHPVKNRQQALAIGISKARQHHYKVPSDR